MNNIQKVLALQNIFAAWTGDEPEDSANITVPYLEEKIDGYPRMTRSVNDAGTEIDIAKLRIDYDILVSANNDAQRITDIKQLANTVILAEYSEDKQRNMTARMIELVNTRITDTLTAEEVAEFESIQNIWNWIKTVRALSNQAEEDGSAPVEISWPVAL